MQETIFCFGSNRQGIHGAGAAKFAREKHGAIRGQGEGLQGSAYAIPTKKTPYVILTLQEIAVHVGTFLRFAHAHPELRFNVTAIGCGLAGYKPHQIGPMFSRAPANCDLCEEFARYRVNARR